ncbi:MAG: hypothetical protein AB7E47_14340 [Desulfovibrionaceae bacterium]
MHRKHIRIVLLTGLFILTTASLAAAGRWGGPGYGPCNAPALTEEQQKAADTIVEEYRATILPLKEAAYTKERELDTLLDSKDVNTMKAEALAKDINELRAKIFSARIAFKLRFAKEVGVVMGPGIGGGQGYGPRNGQGYGPCGGQGYAPCRGQGYAPCGGQGYGPCGGQGYGPCGGQGYGPCGYNN